MAKGFLSGITTTRFVIIACIFALAGAGVYWRLQSQVLPIPQHLQDIGGDFVLQSADGPFALKDFRGKVILLYFGYTNCPDLCPLTMTNWAEALNQLTDAERAQVRGLLVSVDPGRDTPETLKNYTNYFHPNIIGVTGSHEELAKITLLYRSDYTLENSGQGKNYTVDHLSFVYVIDPQGKVRDLLAHETHPEDIVKNIRNALKVKI